MTSSEIMDVLKQVLSCKLVIGTAIVVILYLDFCTFVANYRKKPLIPKKRRAPPAPAKKAPAPPQKDEDADNADAAPSA